MLADKGHQLVHGLEVRRVATLDVLDATAEASVARSRVQTQMDEKDPPCAGLMIKCGRGTRFT